MRMPPHLSIPLRVFYLAIYRGYLAHKTQFPIPAWMDRQPYQTHCICNILVIVDQFQQPY